MPTATSALPLELLTVCVAEASPADDGAGEAEEGFADVVVDSPSDADPARPVQQGETLVNDSGVHVQPGIMLLGATGDQRLDPSLANLLAVFVMVVAAVAVERIRTLGASARRRVSQAGGQVGQGRSGHIVAGRLVKHAKATGQTGDLGREPLYQELLHVRTPTPTSTIRPRTQVKTLSDGDETDGHPFSLVSRIRGRTNRPLTAPDTRLTLIHEEGRIGRCPRVLTDERG